MSSLVAVLFDRVAGIVERDPAGRIRLEYNEDWRHSEHATPLSLSLPLRHRHHASPAVAAYLWGLLPDNEQILERWSRRFHTSARSALGLLSQVGEDCAGAVRFVTAERAGELPSEGEGDVVWLSEREISERLRELREDSSRWRRPNDEGQFSLGGAQGKTALYCEADRWGLPRGRRPTTHVLKPPLGGLDGHVENEHFCLRLARAAGLPAAASQVRTFGGETAIVVERYDRVRTATGVARVHQEDVCQALGVHPASKYQSDGGPGPGDVAALLRSHSTQATDDVLTFLGALAFNWIVAGTDAHAKNYSVLIGRGGRARLAPLYDLASALPYPDIDPRRMKLAMKIGGKYRVHEIGARQWDKLADETALSSNDVRETLQRMTHNVAEQAPQVLAGLTDTGLAHPLLARLSSLVVEHARACERIFR